ncbi:hypothetical protein LI134_11005, partial [Streptococcus parasanguinis]|uniref:hypothetical protein n=1 Tax=Streptococcus parasanguinis TaxID=1318 RepID=UPI001D068CAF
ADNILGRFRLFLHQARCYLPQRNSGSVHGLGAEQKKGKERPNIFKAALGDFVQVFTPLRADKALFKLLFCRSHAGHEQF